MNAAAQPLTAAGHPSAAREPSAVREFVLLALVLLVLVWQFQPLVDSAGQAAAEDRYRLDAALQTAPLVGYGKATLATLCHRIELPPRLQWRWAAACEATDAEEAGDPAALANAAADDLAALQRAIAAGAAERQASVAPLARSLAEGVLAPEDQARLAGTTRGLTEYRARYRLGADLAEGSLTLACAWAHTQHLAATSGNNQPDRNTVLANQLALVRGESGRLWWPPAAGTLAAGWAPAVAGRCSALGSPR
ncbi:MAG TPA: hypothetical protein VK570_04690, partial [Rubrivivax sp.]|nr:hypothetical protein [Rubrivivax sp.]